MTRLPTWLMLLVALYFLFHTIHGVYFLYLYREVFYGWLP